MKQYELPAASIRLVKEAPLLSDTPVNTPMDVVRLLGERISELDREMVCVINLNCKCIPINYSVVSIGTLDGSLMSAREVFKTSILSNASGVILIHNHPSGYAKPSLMDLQITDKMIKAGELLDIPVYDHIIVAGDSYYSMKAEGMLPSAAMACDKPVFPKVAESSDNEDVNYLATVVVDLLKKKGFHISAAESCTAGAFAAAIADVPGASSVLDRSFVTYSESAKQELVGVSLKTISEYGVVSREVAEEMALGAAKTADAEVGVGITGYAGPGGGTKETPVGTVCVGISIKDKVRTFVYLEDASNGRNAVRKKVVENILDTLIVLLQ